MNVTNYYFVANATIPSSWIASLVGFLIAYLIIRFKYNKAIAEVLLDGFFYFILTWKLSVIITQFPTVIKAPLTILYFNGGTIGILLGLVVAMIQVYRAVMKTNVTMDGRIGLFIGVLIAFGSYQVLMAILNEATLLARGITIIGFIAFIAIAFMSIHKNEMMPKQLVVLFIGTEVFIAAFQPNGILHITVLVTLIISLFFYLLLSKQPKQLEESL